MLSHYEYKCIMNMMSVPRLCIYFGWQMSWRCGTGVHIREYPQALH